MEGLRKQKNGKFDGLIRKVAKTNDLVRWQCRCRLQNMQSICIDYAEQTAQSRKANSSIMLNPSARDTKIVFADKIQRFLEYYCQSPGGSRKFVARNAASVIGDTTACCF